MKKFMIILLLFALLAVPFEAGSAEETQSYTPEQLLQIWHQLIAMMREAEIYPYVELQEGDRGYEVIFLQTRLAQLRYYGKAIDPNFGSGTRGAMRMFEQVHKLQVNGAASVEDQKLLFSSKALTNPGTPAGLNPGQTMPPAPTATIKFPGLKLKVTPTPAPTFALFTVEPGQIITPTPAPTLFTFKPGLEKLPELEKLVTPTPAPTLFTFKPEMEKLPGLEKLITPTPVPLVTIKPGLENLIKPDLVLPGYVLPKP